MKNLENMHFTPAKEILELAQSQREKMAAELFDLDTVAQLMTKAAARGEGGIRIAQEMPLDLRETQAAKTLYAKLEEGGFKPKWLEATQKETFAGRETSTFIVFYELTVTWGKINWRGIQNEAPE